LQNTKNEVNSLLQAKLSFQNDFAFFLLPLLPPLPLLPKIAIASFQGGCIIKLF
jgi:hypothetical protein